MDGNAILLAKEKLKEVMDSDVVMQLLINQGYAGGAAEKIVRQALYELEQENEKEVRQKRRKLGTVEFLDRFGFGMSSTQYINIFAFLFGANLFFIGVIHSFASALELLLTFLLDNCQRMKIFFKTEISKIFGLASLFLIAYFMFKMNYAGILIGMLLYSIFFAFYNYSYPLKSLKILKEEKRGFFLRNVALFGVFISSAGMFTTSFILDFFTLNPSKEIVFLGYKLSPPSLLFFLAFVLLLLSWIISLKYRKVNYVEESPETFENKGLENIKAKFKEAFAFSKEIKKDKNLFIFFIGSSLSFVVSLMIYAYLGIFVYTTLSDVGLGAFRNVALVFIIAMISSIIGPFVVRKNAEDIGKLPLLIFGTLLTALLPFSLYLSHGITSITLATLLGVLGMSISETALGLIFMDTIPLEIRKAYFNSVKMLVWLPSLILSLGGAYVASVLGLRVLFLGLAIVQLCIVFPLYFIMLIKTSRKKAIM
ncbi:MAG: hypothetical protein PWQ87_435 [Candidatus Woesearchaeota archaeon]|nr:hypothetical protein [Candidatus Woesearchaeota archaeon]